MPVHKVAAEKSPFYNFIKSLSLYRTVIYISHAAVCPYTKYTNVAHHGHTAALDTHVQEGGRRAEGERGYPVMWRRRRSPSGGWPRCCSARFFFSPRGGARAHPVFGAATMGAAGVRLAAAWSAEHGACELCIYSVHQVPVRILAVVLRRHERPSLLCVLAGRAVHVGVCARCHALDLVRVLSVRPVPRVADSQTLPAHVVCGRLPNIYEENHETMCPQTFTTDSPTLFLHWRRRHSTHAPAVCGRAVP